MAGGYDIVRFPFQVGDPNHPRSIGDGVLFSPCKGVWVCRHGQPYGGLSRA
jgi:hypothetical protein